MLQVFARSNLVHKLVLVPVHSRKLTHMVEGIEDTISKLEGVNVAKSVLHLGVDNEFCQPKDFAHKMESISESRLLSFLGRERLDWLQVEVVVQMQVREVLS